MLVMEIADVLDVFAALFLVFIEPPVQVSNLLPLLSRATVDGGD